MTPNSHLQSHIIRCSFTVPTLQLKRSSRNLCAISTPTIPYEHAHSKYPISSLAFPFLTSHIPIQNRIIPPSTKTGFRSICPKRQRCGESGASKTAWHRRAKKHLASALAPSKALLHTCAQPRKSHVICSKAQDPADHPVNHNATKRPSQRTIPWPFAAASLLFAFLPLQSGLPSFIAPQVSFVTSHNPNQLPLPQHPRNVLPPKNYLTRTSIIPVWTVLGHVDTAGGGQHCSYRSGR
ncbi:hypothetical protein GGI35DRAFT_436896 [Trichoderma velutinum]